VDGKELLLWRSSDEDFESVKEAALRVCQSGFSRIGERVHVLRDYSLGTFHGNCSICHLAVGVS
jgi:hypothetical protein